MNIFRLHDDPVISAQMMCDKHVVKMVTEYGQLLSTAHRVLDGTVERRPSKSGKRMVDHYLVAEQARENLLYKVAHKNHPSAIWCRENDKNYRWLYKHFQATAKEYTKRYGRVHMTYDKLGGMLWFSPKNIDIRLKETKMPVVVMGDFNSDPRDPRMPANPNPGEQPVASDACPAGTSKCNAYLLMTEAGFTDSGPDPLLPENYTWGMNALLTGPDPVRLKVAKQLGNYAGYTDRLDYVFVKNSIKVSAAGIVGSVAPNNLNTDHAGVVATLEIPASSTERSADLPEHAPFPISFWQWVGIVAIASIIALIIRKWRR